MSDKKKEKYQKMADEHNKNVPETVKWGKTGGVRGRYNFSEETQVVVVKNLAAHASGSLYANYEQLLALHILQDVNWEFHSRKNEERNVWGV